MDVFPELENVLLELSPSFAKLKNPVLRKTVARIATLQQAAAIGGLKVDELVNRLRKEVGQDNFSEQPENGSYLVSSPPDWYQPTNVKLRYDACPVINSGGSPMAEILNLTSSLKSGEMLELKTPFVPAPIIDLLKDKGFLCFSIRSGSDILNYFKKR